MNINVYAVKKIPTVAEPVTTELSDISDSQILRDQKLESGTFL